MRDSRMSVEMIAAGTVPGPPSSELDWQSHPGSGHHPIVPEPALLTPSGRADGPSFDVVDHLSMPLGLGPSSLSILASSHAPATPAAISGVTGVKPLVDDIPTANEGYSVTAESNTAGSDTHSREGPVAPKEAWTASALSETVAGAGSPKEPSTGRLSVENAGNLAPSAANNQVQQLLEQQRQHGAAPEGRSTKPRSRIGPRCERNVKATR